MPLQVSIPDPNDYIPYTLEDVYQIFDESNSLHQDILLWTLQRQNPNLEFDFTELGNWLIDNHRPFVKEFSNSHIRRSYRLHSKRNYIQSRINDLIGLDLITKGGTTKSKKNNSEKPIYSFTETAFYLAQLLEARNSTGKKRSIATQKLWNLIKTNLIEHPFVPNTNSFSLIISRFIDKCVEKKLLEDIESNLDLFICLIPDAIAYDALRRIILVTRRFTDVFLETINELDEGLRKLVLFQIKLDVERDLNLYSSQDWEITRYKNIGNHEKVTLDGLCEACYSFIPFQMDTLEFIKLRYTGPPKIERLDCPRCHNKDSMTISPKSHGSWMEPPLGLRHVDEMSD